MRTHRKRAAPTKDVCLKMRNLPNTDYFMTYAEISAATGLTRTSIERAEKSGLKKIRDEICKRNIHLDDLMCFDKLKRNIL